MILTVCVFKSKAGYMCKYMKTSTVYIGSQTICACQPYYGRLSLNGICEVCVVCIILLGNQHIKIYVMCISCILLKKDIYHVFVTVSIERVLIARIFRHTDTYVYLAYLL